MSTYRIVRTENLLAPTLAAIFLITGCSGLATHDGANPFADAGTQVDASAPEVPEVLAPYDCVAAPRAEQGIEAHGASYQILLDGDSLYDCYTDPSNMPPCRGFADSVQVYECTSKQLGGAS